MAGLFDRVVDGINRGVATVGANSKAVMDKAKVNAAISNLDGERLHLAQLLGLKIYEMYKSKGEIAIDQGMTSLMGEIDKRVELIAKQQESLKRIDEEVSLVTGGGRPAGVEVGTSCAGCGHINHTGAKFCAGCGSQM